MAKEEYLVGASVDELNEAFAGEDFALDACLLAYLSVFGKKNITLNITVEGIKRATAEARRILGERSFSTYNELIGARYPHLDEIIPIYLNCDKYGPVFTVAVSGIENSVLHYAWPAKDSETEGLTFVSQARSRFFWSLMGSIWMGEIPKTELDWVNAYLSSFQELPNLGGPKVILWREDYCLLATEREIVEGRLMGVTEFEEGFLRYYIARI